MKICLAQTKPVKGDIASNIAHHLKLIEAAIPYKADCIFFPELSLTGYEPTLAGALAIATDDNRLTVFQTISDTHRLTIGVGAPVKTDAGITISLLLFQPGKKRAVYAKQFLHPDETPFFISGNNTAGFIGEKEKTALAICYELSVPEHAATAFRHGAAIYVASVAKTNEGVKKAAERLIEIAREYTMTVLMVNGLGLNDGMVCAGQSAAWNKRGEWLGQLNDSREGLLMMDTETGTVVAKHL